jgi:alpha,alpha-trehalase
MTQQNRGVSKVENMGNLFQDVQMSNTLGDGKTFPDCVPKFTLATIKKHYEAEKNLADFDLKAFVLRHFDLPNSAFDDFKSDPNKTITEHIDGLWQVLTRKPDKSAGSLIPLPHAYVVPGGRFREIYYWDSYFTMLGLRISNRVDLIENMVDNFAYLLRTIGHIPNGNRTYYVGRSQPPFFAAMVQLLSAEKGDAILVKYLPELVLEYQFWMKKSRGLKRADKNALERVCYFPELVLNRYWDENCTPRPESYREDVEIAHNYAQKPDIIYRHLRAAAESGWDFSSRWFKKTDDLATIHTTDIVPIDLNCLLYNLEKTIAQAQLLNGQSAESASYQSRADQRAFMVNTHCWNAEKGFYFDYDFVEKKQTQHLTLAAVFPLFFKIASQEQAEKVAIILMDKFLKTGGLTTTLNKTGQQWDAPNGWSPLQWMAYKGLINYGLSDAANRLKTAWLNTNERIYKKTGKMTEKYDVFNQDEEAGGGEYPLQDGFGWSNGVFLALNAVYTEGS